MIEQKQPPAMFAGAVPPKDQPAAAKPVAPTSATTKQQGVSAGRLGGIVLIPVAAVGLLALGAVNPTAAVIAGIALVVVAGAWWLIRSSARNRVATTTKVRPDGTVTTSTRPHTRPGRNSKRRSRSGPGASRPHNESGSPGVRNRSWVPGADRRKDRRPSSAPGDPGSQKGGRPGSGSPGGPTGRPRMWDRMRPGKSDRNARHSPSAPGGGGSKPPNSKSPGSAQPPKAPGSPKSGSRWPWPRSKSKAGPGTGKSPGGSPTQRGGKPSASNGGNSRSPASHNRPPGAGEPKAPKNAKHAAPSAPPSRGTKPSKVPNWVKRAVVPASAPPQRDWTGGATRRARDKVRGKWHGAWADKSEAGIPARADEGGAAGPPAAGTERTVSPPSSAATEGRYRRARRKLSRRPKSAPVDHAARLDEVWKARGLGKRQAPMADPVVKPKAAASSAAGAAFAEDWAPSPQPQAPSRHSAEAGLMAEGDWTPSKIPTRSAPRSADKGGSTMSENGSSESQASAGTTKAYEDAQGDSRAAAGIATNTANMLRADAARLPNTPRMAPHKAALGVQAGKWARVSAVYSAIASKLGQSAAKHQGGERLQ